MSNDLYVEHLPQYDQRLGRQIVHDDRSRAYAFPDVVDSSTWRTKSVRIYDPRVNPNQPIGCCTGCAHAMMFNAVGNRLPGKVLGLEWAIARYSRATALDVWPGSYPPDDTGSSGLAVCKASQEAGDGGVYRFLFGGVDQVVQAIMLGQVVSVGTKWLWDMFHPDAGRFIQPTGGLAGGHQYVARGYIEPLDAVVIRCWWGPGFRDVLIKREHLGDLLADRGDAVIQARAGVSPSPI